MACGSGGRIECGGDGDEDGVVGAVDGGVHVVDHDVFYDPSVADGFEKALGIRRVHTLRELLLQAHCISLHCNATKENEKFINSTTLAVMKKGVFVVNTARGELIDEEALAEALRSGQVGAAALDVHWGEPFVKGQGPLGDAPNLMCTPHSAWYSGESRLEMRQKGVAAVKLCIQGEEPRNVVNRAYLKDTND